jgi:hypothetical protein
MEQENLSQFDEFEAPNFKRRALIPLWIQIFCWLFMIMGLFAFLSGIIICIAVMIITGITQGGNFSLRFEILFLLAYFIKISNIEYSWYNMQY